MDAAPVPDGGVEAGLGGPCVDDGQCDDEIECTEDVCDDEIGRCRHEPNDDACEDDVYCDGREVCDPSLGCRDGEPIACSDQGACTIDRCVEESRSCEHFPRDADNDGDTVWNCGGADCNDENPRVSSETQEICDNNLDDDCDEDVDEDECERAKYDTCAQALTVEGEINTEISLVAAAADYAATCVEGASTTRDIVFRVPASESARDIEVLAISPLGGVALAAFEECGEVTTELACAASREAPDLSEVARLRLRAVEDETFWVLFSDNDGPVNLKLRFLDPEPPPANETCGTALPLVPGESQRAEVYSAATDLQSACPLDTGELTYSFTLEEPRDVWLFAAAEDAYGEAVVSLRASACTKGTDELTCRHGSATDLFVRALPAGDYTVAVAGNGSTIARLRLETDEPSPAPASDRCEDAPELELGVPTPLNATLHTDSIEAGCLPGSVDLAQRFTLEQRSDLLVLQSLSTLNEAALSITGPGCTREETLVCERATGEARVLLSNVAAGDYALVSEVPSGAPLQVTLLSRPAAEPTLVLQADSCDDVFEIPESGGVFQGNTALASPVYDALCDIFASPSFGAPDQLLKLSLSERRRVVIDSQGSSFRVMLNLRSGATCPGREQQLGCSRGSATQPAVVDLVLDAGDYYIQVDGYDGQMGLWTLNVFTVAP